MRSEPSLVYRAAARAVPETSSAPASAPAGMTTLELNPATVAGIRNGYSPVQALMIARQAEEEAATATPEAGGGGTQAEGDRPPSSAGPSASPQAVEADAGKQIGLEMLARQIYDRLRSRLLVERERSGIGAGMVSR
jgi:hypothetical protein